MPQSQPIDISIIIPARNEQFFLPACLDAIESQTTSLQWEVIVVDNNSTDMTGAIARDRGYPVMYEATPGVGAARRAGTSAAKGTYILHIDADTQLPPTYIDDALKRFATDDTLVCLGGQMYWYDASLFLNTIRGVFYRVLSPLVRLISRGALGPMGNNMIFLKSIYDQCDGFDSGLKFGEDADLTRQMRAYGRVFLDLSLICQTSSRRFQFNTDFFVYILNTIRICVGMKPLKNELPSSKKHTARTIDKQG